MSTQVATFKEPETVGELLLQLETYEHSSEYYNNLKEAFELELMGTILEGNEYLQENQELNDEIKTYIFSESCNIDDVFYEEYETRLGKFAGMLARGIEKVIQGILTFFRRVANIFTGNMDKRIKDLELVAEYYTGEEAQGKSPTAIFVALSKVAKGIDAQGIRWNNSKVGKATTVKFSNFVDKHVSDIKERNEIKNVARMMTGEISVSLPIETAKIDEVAQAVAEAGKLYSSRASHGSIKNAANRALKLLKNVESEEATFINKDLTEQGIKNLIDNLEQAQKTLKDTATSLQQDVKTGKEKDDTDKRKSGTNVQKQATAGISQLSSTISKLDKDFRKAAKKAIEQYGALATAIKSTEKIFASHATKKAA